MVVPAVPEHLRSAAQHNLGPYQRPQAADLHAHALQAERDSKQCATTEQEHQREVAVDEYAPCSPETPAAGHRDPTTNQ